ncbi:DUF2975 domain-containing protein [Kineosporia sp. NBRC 101731]|uniref:DUF2975 domain-containing protein n=1 Tax=Kineosporia sp. NBRC 101731 TaxID=3032199 RepID=UPI0024A4D55E|nr:DUF2975 domain-containing protein [Kineosporia sp. NBRC 101731]GLY31985.1 hypothetical protein Kisp02_53500 [Kineosporia sp. NBRC 101731]
MTRRAFRIGGWAALALGALAALSAVIVVVTGALALTGRVTYPVDASLGPFSVHDRVSMPVAVWQEVCQKASVDDSGEPSDCLRLFLHQNSEDSGSGPVHVQDADVRPTDLYATGSIALATTGGWSPLVAASVARKAIGLMVISAVLLLLWRLLANSAAGDVFSTRAVRQVRGIGWLVILGNLVKPAVAFAVSFDDGYSMPMFGYGHPFVEKVGEAGVNLTQLALGGLILLLAEAFRHGAVVEAERRLTV